MRLSGKKWLDLLATIYVNGMRSIPLVMVILWFFLLMPMIIGKPIGVRLRPSSPLWFEAAYFSEIMRAGIQSIPRGQVFAGGSGMTYGQNMRLVVLPSGIPQHAACAADADHHPVSGHVAGLCHWRLRHAQGLRDRGQELRSPHQSYLAAAMTYFVICFALSWLVKRLYKNSHHPLSRLPQGIAMIELKNVSKWYGSFQVLSDCSTNINKGEVVVVCGPSGSGKSTLIKTINALEPFQKGEIGRHGRTIPRPTCPAAQPRGHGVPAL